MKILHSADWHILLHKKKVPYEWQKNRFELFFKKLLDLENTCSLHIISGDLFDKKPEPDEICLLLSYLNRVTIPTYIIPGNHEATKKGESFLEHFKYDRTIDNPNVSIITKNERVVLDNKFNTPISIQFFPYGEMELNNLPEYNIDDILVTHIRGEVPPHITEEYDFEKLRQWKLVLLGDLHFQHKYKDFPAYYSGSPLNVTFDRDSSRDYGVNIINFNNINDYTVEFVPLDLPKLIRKTIKNNEDMIKDSFHHIIYEVTGSVDELAKITNSDLLDKKIAITKSEESKLDLKNKTIIEELDAYLSHINVKNKETIIKEFKDLNINV